jgi:hypothetical protein
MLENLFLKEHVRKYLEVIKASGKKNVITDFYLAVVGFELNALNSTT